jgi:hypothetical protein
MALRELHPLRLWGGLILFFGVGVAIALAVASRMIDRGESAARAVAIGAFAGACGAWVVFFAILNTVKRIRGES